MFHVRRSPLVVAVIVMLGACGSDAAPGATGSALGTDPPATEPRATDVCGLVTQEEISVALGHPALPGVASEEDGASVCRWKSTVPSNNSSLSSPPTLAVAVLPFGPDDDAALTQLADDVDNTVIQGLGDRALIEGGTLKGPLFVVVGDRYLHVELTNYGVPDDYSGNEVVAMLTAVATSAVGRL